MKMGLYQDSLYEPYCFGVTGPGFLNQVPTLSFRPLDIHQECSVSQSPSFRPQTTTAPSLNSTPGLITLVLTTKVPKRKPHYHTNPPTNPLIRGHPFQDSTLNPKPSQNPRSSASQKNSGREATSAPRLRKKHGFGFWGFVVLGFQKCVRVLGLFWHLGVQSEAFHSSLGHSGFTAKATGLRGCLACV